MPANMRSNAIVDHAIRSGTSAANEGDTGTPTRLILNVAQEKKVSELSSVLGLSLRMVLNIAIKLCVHHVGHVTATERAKLLKTPTRGKTAIKILLTAETLQKLRAAQLDDQAQTCAWVGIDLLHDRLLASYRAR